MNSIIAIHPYQYQGLWVFDDPAVGLVQEPFPGHQIELAWMRADMSGNWYRSSALNMEGWLCPALLKYFDSPPAKLYAQFRARRADKG